MKPASVIFLAVALIIAGAGFFLCVRAEKQAEAQNIELFNISTDTEETAVSGNAVERRASENLRYHKRRNGLSAFGTEQKIE